MDEVLDDVENLRFRVYINPFLALLETASAQVKAARSFGGLDEVAAFFELLYLRGVNDE